MHDHVQMQYALPELARWHVLRTHRTLPKESSGKYIVWDPSVQFLTFRRYRHTVLLLIDQGLDTAKGTKMVTIGEAFCLSGVRCSSYSLSPAFVIPRT